MTTFWFYLLFCFSFLSRKSIPGQLLTVNDDLTTFHFILRSLEIILVVKGRDNQVHVGLSTTETHREKQTADLDFLACSPSWTRIYSDERTTAVYLASESQHSEVKLYTIEQADKVENLSSEFWSFLWHRVQLNTSTLTSPGQLLICFGTGDTDFVHLDVSWY